MVDSTQVEKATAGLMEKRLREALKELDLSGKGPGGSGTTELQKVQNDRWLKAKDETRAALALPKTQAEKEAAAGQAARDILHFMIGDPHKCIVCHSDLEKNPDHKDCPEPVCPGKAWHDAEAALSK